MSTTDHPDTDRRAPRTASPAATAGTPRSSDRVLALLQVIVAADRDLSLTEAAERVGLAASTTTRQLASLEAAGLVERHDTGYRVGPTMVRLSHRVVGRSPLPRLARSLLEDLAHETGESAYLAVVHDDQTAIYVAAAEGTHHLRHAGWQGRTVPRDGTAVGQALVGRSAVGHDTVEAGVTGVSAPVHGADDTVVAAVSVLGPTFRLQDQPLALARTATEAAAIRLGRLLGSSVAGDDPG